MTLLSPPFVDVHVSKRTIRITLAPLLNPCALSSSDVAPTQIGTGTSGSTDLVANVSLWWTIGLTPRPSL